MFSRFLLLVGLSFLPAIASAAPFTAFRDGEKFVYKVSFAIFSHAGDITITAHDETKDGVALMRVTNETRSRGFVRGVYAFDNKAELVIDKASNRVLSVKESGEDPKRATDTSTEFDYKTRIARFVDRVRPERSRDIPIPDGDPVDLISALVQTRDWNLKPGDERDLVVHFGRDLFEITIRAEGYEQVRTPLGNYRTLMLVPYMKKEPKGLFKRGGEIKVWIAQDAANLPVKMQLKLNFGTATLLLSNYQPSPSK